MRSVSDIDQALSALDVALASAFNPAGSVSDVFTGLHAHYKVRVSVRMRKGGSRKGVLQKCFRAEAQEARRVRQPS